MQFHVPSCCQAGVFSFLPRVAIKTNSLDPTSRYASICHSIQSCDVQYGADEDGGGACMCMCFLPRMTVEQRILTLYVSSVMVDAVALVFTCRNGRSLCM